MVQLVRGSISIEADRHEVSEAGGWAAESGSDFFFEPDAAQLAGAGNSTALSDRGWTTTGLAFVAASLDADFLSEADPGVPAHYEGLSAGDLIQSPAIFGDFQHAHQAGHHLGFDASTLTFEAFARFSVTSADEEETCLGFCDATGSIIVISDAIAVIRTDGTNFILRSTADSSTGALDDEDLHLFRIVVSGGSATDAIEWFIDGTSQGTIDRLPDVWPAAVGVGNLAAGTNRIQIGQFSVFYR